MITRILEKKVREAARKYPVVLLTGPRQSGKKTLCRLIFPQKPYISFEDPDNREFADKDPRGLLDQYSKGAVFDEIQRCPALLSYLQGIVDRKQKSGMYILMGSQNILLLKSIQQSLAGRIAIFKLLPFAVDEIVCIKKNVSPGVLMYAGGFPRIYDKKLNPTEAMRNYVESYVERDVRNIINIKNLSYFQRFLKLCAGRVGQILNLSSIGNDIGISHITVREWLSILEASFIVYLLPAYYRNFNKRIIKSPKIYFTDTGLACYLLGIEEQKQVLRDPLMGGLFENFVITELLKCFWNDGRNAPLYFFRDNIGNETDLLIEKARQVFCLEIKAGHTVGSDWFRGLGYVSRIMKKSLIGQGIIYGGKDGVVREGVKIIPYNKIRVFYSTL